MPSSGFYFEFRGRDQIGTAMTHCHFDNVTIEFSLSTAPTSPQPNSSTGEDPGDSPNDDDSPFNATGTQTIAQPKQKTKVPSMYRVLLLNDDFTPMDFVIHILQKFFQKEYDEAARIMLEVHTQGAGVAGTYSYEVAETKVYQVNQYSKENQHPLKCTMEKV